MGTSGVSEYKEHASLAKANAGRSAKVVELLDDDDPLEGCRMPKPTFVTKGRKQAVTWQFCLMPSLYKTTYKMGGFPLCKTHAEEHFEKCVEDECVYEGNYHGGPWDYDCNAPADEDGAQRCYLHAREYGLGDDDGY